MLNYIDNVINSIVAKFFFDDMHFNWDTSFLNSTFFSILAFVSLSIMPLFFYLNSVNKEVKEEGQQKRG